MTDAQMKHLGGRWWWANPKRFLYIARPACQTETALDVVRGPAVANALLCGLHGQAYIAETAIGRNLGAGQYVKIMCRRSSRGGNVG